MPEEFTPTTEGAPETIAVVQEVATIEKRRVERVGALVRIEVEEREQSIEALLARQDVLIERVPMGTPVVERPVMRQEGDVVIVPVFEERLVVEKRLFLKEELRIRISETKRPEQQTVSLRQETAHIDHHGAEPNKD